MVDEAQLQTLVDDVRIDNFVAANEHYDQLWIGKLTEIEAVEQHAKAPYVDWEGVRLVLEYLRSHVAS